MTEPSSDYVRQLEDAIEVLWGELPVREVKRLRHEMPQLSDFLCHLHDRMSHEEFMVRSNVWAEDDEADRASSEDVDDS